MLAFLTAFRSPRIRPYLSSLAILYSYSISFLLFSSLFVLNNELHVPFGRLEGDVYIVGARGIVEGVNTRLRMMFSAFVKVSPIFRHL